MDPPPPTESPGPFGPGTPKECEESLERVSPGTLESAPRSPRRDTTMANVLRKVQKVAFRGRVNFLKALKNFLEILQ